METKHLRSDFIRSFLCLHFNKPIPEYDLSNEEDLKLIKIATFHSLLDNPSIILIDCPARPELISENYPFSPFTSIVNSYKQLSDLSKRIGILNNDIVLRIGPSLLIYKKQINTNEYYTLLPYILKSYAEDFSQILEKINSIAYEDVLINLNKDNLAKISERITKLPNTSTLILDRKLNDLNNELDNINAKYRAIKESMAKVYAEKALSLVNNDNNPFTKFLTYLLKCKAVKSIYTPKLNNSFECQIHLNWFPVSYTYGDTALQKMIYENASFKNNTNKEILYDALKDRQHFEIMHMPVKITIKYNFSSNKLSYSINCVTDCISMSSAVLECRIQKDPLDRLLYCYFRNVHYFEFGCLGSFRPDLDQAMNEGNPTRLFATLLQYLSTINITDGAGAKWLTQPHIIKKKTDNTWFYMNPATGILVDIPEHIIKDINFGYKTEAYIKEDNL